MKKISTLKLLSLGFILTLVAGVGASVANATVSNIGGWAWSENIGWISFNSANHTGEVSATYGVTLGEPAAGNVRTFDGYAWSSNIGWISFKPSDLSGCPSGTCTARDVNGVLEGWARACAATVGGACSGALVDDGWTGWISFKGGSPTATPPNDYGSVYVPADGEYRGYAWGHEVIGWIGLRMKKDVDISALDAAISATSPIGAGGVTAANLTVPRPFNCGNGPTNACPGYVVNWTSSGPATRSCTVTGTGPSNTYTGANGKSGSETVPNTTSFSTTPPNPAYHYSITCTEGTDTVTKHAYISITDLPEPPPVVTVCVPNKTTAVIGETVTWSLQTPPSGNPTYAWSSATAYPATANTVTYPVTYSSPGNKTATITLTPPGAPPVPCGTTVRITRNPIFVPH